MQLPVFGILGGEQFSVLQNNPKMGMGIQKKGVGMAKRQKRKKKNNLKYCNFSINVHLATNAKKMQAAYPLL